MQLHFYEQNKLACIVDHIETMPVSEIEKVIEMESLFGRDNFEYVTKGDWDAPEN